MAEKKASPQRKNKEDFTHMEIHRNEHRDLETLRVENGLASRSIVVKKLIENNKGKKL